MISAIPCTNNVYDDNQGDGQCDSLIAAGSIACATDLADGGQYAHYCDQSCGFDCINDGLVSIIVHVLPPGATETAQSVASEMTVANDKALGFTAAATGRYTVRVGVIEGQGSANVVINAVGTTEKRSPSLIADGLSHPLGVRCESRRCR